MSVNVLCQVWWGTDHLGGALVLAKGAHLECLVVAVWKGSSGLVAGLAEQRESTGKRWDRVSGASTIDGECQIVLASSRPASRR